MSVARKARLGVERAGFELWARRLDFALRRSGSRLELDAPHGAHAYELPRFEVVAHGTGGVLRLKLGHNVHLGRRLIIETWAGSETTVQIDDDVRFSANTRLSLFGGELQLGSLTGLRDGVLLNVSGGRMIFGHKVQVRRDAMFHCSQSIRMHDLAGVAERVTVVDSDHSHDGSDHFYMDQPLRTGPISIGRNTSIFANAIVMRDVTIGPNCVIGAGAMVRSGDYPGQTLYAGSPAVAVRRLGDGRVTS